ncbi:MAG: PQQ-dependent sugar dehydrogenase [Thermoanaerobaculia bacterium]
MLRFLSLIAALANTPPSAPVILEPAMELQALNGADVHMVTSEFIDADGDGHFCTDWEIREGETMVWSAPCAEGPLKVHIHLGDGVFSGSHTGVTELHANSRFELRARYRDDAGASSEWSTRQFQTVLPTPIAPLRVDEVRNARWRDVPAGASIELQTVDGEPLPALTPAVVRLRIAAGDGEWILPESEYSLEDGHGNLHTIFLPAIALQPHAEQFFWISANGGTHFAEKLERTPDFTRIARGAPVPWTVERGFRAEIFASGFQLPVSLVAVPNPGDAPDSPFLYVAELYGNVKVITRSGEVRTFATGLINFDPLAPIPGKGERGLGGITTDPNNGDVIVTGVYRHELSAQYASPRVLRLQSDDGGRTAARIMPVIEFPGESTTASHQISNITFGPDGKLYVHVGSSFSWIAQDMNTIDGKILRINGDGSAPADNPFYDASNGISATDYIFALGFRNHFGGAWRVADQSLYEVENGPSTDRLAKVVRGRNYLWDGFDPSMRNYAIYNWTSPVAPIQIAFTQPGRFDGSGFPESKLRSAFVTESGATWATGPQKHGKQITEFEIGFNETLVSGPTTFAKYDGSGKATAAGLVAAPDGLYFTDLYRDYGYTSAVDAGANVIRIRWVGWADFDARFYNASTLALIDRSNVPDVESIAWDFGDGTTSNDRNAVHRYVAAGTYIVRQTVTGSRGTVTHAQRVFAGGNAAVVHAEYYDSEDATTPILVRSERSLDFNALPAPVARFTVGITPRFSETYTFTVHSADRVSLTLDGKPLPETNAVPLIAGHPYELGVRYAKNSDAPALRVTWESASQRSLTVPQSASTPRRRAVTPP